LKEKNKKISDLKHDNKSLAKQVSDKNNEISELKNKLHLLEKLHLFDNEGSFNF